MTSPFPSSSLSCRNTVAGERPRASAISVVDMLPLSSTSRMAFSFANYLLRFGARVGATCNDVGSDILRITTANKDRLSIGSAGGSPCCFSAACVCANPDIYGTTALLVLSALKVIRNHVLASRCKSVSYLVNKVFGKVFPFEFVARHVARFSGYAIAVTLCLATWRI